MNLSKLKNNKTWNAVQTKFGHKATTEIHGGWIHYLDSNLDWADIDCLLVEGDNGFKITKAPFTFIAPKFSDGSAFFNITNRFDVFKKETIEALPFGQHITALGVARVPGELFDINGDGRLDAVKYPHTYGFGIHLVYYVQHGRAPRLKKLVMFDVGLIETREFKFKVEFTTRPEISPKYKLNQTRRAMRDWADSMFNLKQPVYADKGFYVRQRGEAQKRGIGIKNPLIWDSEEKAEEIPLYMDRGGDVNTYTLTKVINADFFTDAVLPVFTDTTSTFYPDPDPETTSVDGLCRRVNTSGETWNTMRTSAGTQAFPSSVNLSARIGADANTDKFDIIERNAVGFDTSSIPDADTISSATLSLYGHTAPDTALETPVSTIVSISLNSDTAVITSDYNIAGWGGTRFADDLDGGSWNSSGYNVHTLNASGLAYIDVAGVTNFGWSLASDRDDTEPTWASTLQSEIIVSAADAAGTGQDPKLIVVHSAPRTAGRGRTKSLHRKATGMSVGLN
jgi:hypothetical protein